MNWLGIALSLVIVSIAGTLMMRAMRRTEDNESWGDGPRTPPDGAGLH